MDVKELYKAKDMAAEVLTTAGKKLKPYHGKIEHLSKDDDLSPDNHTGAIVTKLDRETEQFIASEFNKFDDSIGFRGEEFGIKKGADRTWLVDPIDGTAHFVRGLPFCTSMVALIEDEEVKLALIHHFLTGDTYWAIKGEGAFKNSLPIHVSNRPLKQSLVSFETNIHKGENAKLFKEFRSLAIVFNSINCGFEFSMVAEGRTDGRIAIDPYGEDWDFAPGSLLVSEAGGIVSNIGSSSYNYRNHNYIAANPLVHRELTGPGGLFS